MKILIPSFLPLFFLPCLLPFLSSHFLFSSFLPAFFLGFRNCVAYCIFQGLDRKRGTIKGMVGEVMNYREVSEVEVKGGSKRCLNIRVSNSWSHQTYNQKRDRRESLEKNRALPLLAQDKGAQRGGAKKSQDHHRAEVKDGERGGVSSPELE